MKAVCFLMLACVLGAQGKLSAYERYRNVMMRIANDPVLNAAWKEHAKRFVDRSPKSRQLTSMFCESQPSAKPPTSVHALRPADVKVVSALGDSLTAGNGVLAWTVIGVLTEYRGRSWSIGGDNDLDAGVTTFPNILRKFNPDVIGYSLDSGDVNSAGANLNVAVAGAVSANMPDQARMLVTRMQSDSQIDWVNDWKVVTLFIGGNDLCAFCEDREAYKAENYIATIREALDILHAEMPRAFVNLVEIFDIRPVAKLSSGFFCNLVVGSVCDCGHNPTPEQEAELGQYAAEYQRATQQLVASGRYETRDDFTVVLQPFFRETEPPKEPNSENPDLSYFAPDCFHFSSKGQGAAARALWNNMLQPVGQKQVQWNLDDPIACPNSGKPFFRTSKN